MYPYNHKGLWSKNKKKIAIGMSDETRRIEGVEGNEKRLNDLLRVPFYREPKVHIDAFILKVTVNKSSYQMVIS